MFQTEVLNHYIYTERPGEILVQMTDVTDGMLQKEVLNHYIYIYIHKDRAKY